MHFLIPTVKQFCCFQVQLVYQRPVLIAKDFLLLSSSLPSRKTNFYTWIWPSVSLSNGTSRVMSGLQKFEDHCHAFPSFPFSKLNTPCSFNSSLNKFLEISHCFDDLRCANSTSLQPKESEHSKAIKQDPAANASASGSSTSPKARPSSLNSIKRWRDRYRAKLRVLHELML